MTIAEVWLWGTRIGAVSWDDEQKLANFQYTPDILTSNYQMSPFHMPLGKKVYRFPSLDRNTFKGLPGMLAESLPDKFGEAVIEEWLAREGRDRSSFTPVDELCYIGSRGMGALEYRPSTSDLKSSSEVIELGPLIQLANDILAKREGLHGNLSGSERENTLKHILAVSTSAGGARAKAIIAWNKDTNEIRSGQVEAGEGFSYWLLKFDGVSNNKDKELNDPKGFGLIEYAYYKMATAAKIDMAPSEILKENGRSHFITRRFDRTDDGSKRHMQSLAALRHFDFNMANAYSYEQAFETIKMLGLPHEDIERQFRRACFNIVARNQDDHVKNIAFLMDKDGRWSLSPAYDVTYSYNPQGRWTGKHQMSFNGKRNQFKLEDFKAVGKFAGMKRGRAGDILDEVTKAVSKWEDIARKVGVLDEHIKQVQKVLRLDIIS